MTKEEFVQLVYLNLSREISDEQFAELNEQTISGVEWSELRAETEATWDDLLDDMPTNAEASKLAFPRVYESIDPDRPSLRKLILLRYSPAVAAVALLVLAAAFIFGEGYNTFSAGAGVEHIVLEDGTEIYLAPNSELKVSKKNGRSVKLDGDAYFEVAKDPEQAFTVKTAAADITILGTKFSILAEESETRLDVNEGKVRIENKTNTAAEIVTIGQSAIANKVTQEISMVDYLSNHQGPFTGKYQFRNRPLSEVLAELSIILETKIVADPAIADCLINGVLYAKNKDGLLSQVADYYDATLSDGQGTYYIENGKCK